MVNTKQVLAVGAHPDDVEILCAGTLFLLKRLGLNIHVAALSRGDCGSKEFGPEELSAMRRAEAESAAHRLGAQFHGLGFSDFQIFHNDDALRRVTALIRDVDPFLVITHPPQDYMLDHDMTSLLVRSACFTAPMPNYDTSRHTAAGVSSGLPALFYMHPLGGTDHFGNPVEPHFYVDISEVLDDKAEMLACHESQRNWLRAQHGMDEYVESMKRTAVELGEKARPIAGRQIHAAEAFRQHRGHPYPHENVLFDLLKGNVWMSGS